MIGFICGAWDLLHPGHIHALKECKKYCSWLIVGLQVDPSRDRNEKSRPVQSIFERAYQLKGCKYVDEIIPYETEDDLLNLLYTVDIDIRFLGDDYDRPEAKIIGKEIVPIKFIPRSHSYSSSELRRRMK